jgi:hypothetical protein
MPNYNAQNPPYSIFPGDVALAFNNEAPAAGQASQQFALPSYAGFPENGRTIRWQVSFATAPSAVTIQLQTAMNDEPGRVRGAGEFCTRQSDFDHWRLRRDGADTGLGSFGNSPHRSRVICNRGSGTLQSQPFDRHPGTQHWHPETGQ